MSEKRIRVLFVCIHNSARSQMAEAFLKKIGGQDFEVESAGLEPGKLNPLAVTVMQEAGIDISGHSTDSVFEYLKEGRNYDFVVTVCDETSGERCPIFPGKTRRMHWGFEDPSGLRGSEDEKLVATRCIRDQIKERVKQFVTEDVDCDEKRGCHDMR